MADTYTPALKARKIEPGTRSNTWGAALNADALDILDAGITGATTVNILSATTYTLAAIVSGTLGESHFFGLNFTGTPASAVTITVPASVTFKTFLVYNNTGQSLTIKYAATGGVVVKNGARQEIWCDGTTVYAVSFGLTTDNTVTGENTFSAQQTFTSIASGGKMAAVLNSASPMLGWYESDAASSNRMWTILANGEALAFRASSDDASTSNTYMVVNRTGTTVDSVAFPTTTGGAFYVGTTTLQGSPPAAPISQFYSSSSNYCALFTLESATVTPVVVHSRATAGDNAFIAFGTEAAYSARGSIDYNRGGGLVRYNTTSDRRLKTNIVDAPSASSIIDGIRVRSFDWIDGGAHLDHWLVAQELFEVAPHAVSEGDHGETVEKQWAVDPAKLVPLLIKELQDLRKRVAQLETDQR